MVSPTGHLPLDVVVHVAEVAEVAWEAIQSRAEHSANAVARERECVEAEGALAREKLENKRLQATLQEYKNTLEQLQRRPGSPEWLGRSLSTAQGTADVYRRLQEKVESPEFLEKLSCPPVTEGEIPTETTVSAKDGILVNVDVANPSWWTWVTENDMYGAEPSEERDGLGGDSYVLIEADDVVDGIANFIARYLQTLPQTKEMSPKELQSTISQAFTELRTKNSAKRLWDWGRSLYTYSCWATTAFGYVHLLLPIVLYKNPMVVRATLVAIWTSARIICGILK